MTLPRYLAHRRRFETAFWIVLLTAQCVANVVVVRLDWQRAGKPLALWEPVVWEASSLLMVGLLIPAIAVFAARVRTRAPSLRAGLLAHLLATPVFCVIHVVGMVALREAAYALAGGDYDFGAWPRELAYEYVKDIQSYFTIVALIELYGLLLRRWQGEARMLSDDAPTPRPVTDRFLVKKLGREFLVRVADIDWIESAGNYVTLHVGDTGYLLRDTMAAMAARLDGQGFARVHRSAIVNLDRVAQITPFDTGDGEAELTGGARVPVSRRYRADLKQRLQQ